MQYEKLLEALSEKLGIEIENVGGATAVEVDGQVVILQLAGARDDDILFTHADLGEIPIEGKEALAASALSANYLYQGTGGATLALNSADGHLHLQRYDWLDRLDVDRTVEILGRFAETAAAWRGILADYHPSEAMPELDIPSFGDSGFLKV